MLECLWLIDMVTEGEVNAFSEEKVINTSEYLMKVYTGKGECVNFADSGVKLPIYYGSIYKFAELTKNDELKAFAKTLYDTRKSREISKKREIIAKSIRVIDMLTYSPKLEAMPDIKFTPKSDYYFESTEVLTSKSNSDPECGLYLAAKGGHNDESHNHNDIGNFIVYKNGTKFLVDSGNMQYCKDTFSSKRYTLWTTRSLYHNLPVIGGEEQLAGRDYAAKDAVYEQSDNCVNFSLDIKNAYKNRDNIKHWRRSLKYDKTQQIITVSEDYSFKTDMEVELHFLTPQTASFSKNNLLLKSETGEELKISFDNEDFMFNTETIDIDDGLLLKNWGNKLYMITLKLKKSANNGSIKYTIK